MANRKSTLLKVYRAAILSFENAVRLHDDAILLLIEGRSASGLYMSALAMEEIGKYFLYEDIWFYNNTGSEWTEQQIEEALIRSYSHVLKQKVFANRHIDLRRSDPLLAVLQKGELETIKQRSIYAGFSRKGKRIRFDDRVTGPSRRGFKGLATRYITLVNDFFIVLSLGVRKGCFLLDIPEIHDWLAIPEFEAHFVEAWPNMTAQARQEARKFRKLADDPAD